MSGNKFQIKRTGVAGRQPNTSNSSNTSYIDVGELALNFADGILYSSNGSTLLELGANVTNQTITGTLSANGTPGANGQALFSGGSGIYWDDIQTIESTDSVVEGNTNLYFTEDRAVEAIETNTVNTVSVESNFILPIGNTETRPAPAAAGMMRFNTDFGQFEGYNGQEWVGIESKFTFAGDLELMSGTEDLNDCTQTDLIDLNE